jgi:hypothetical protein
MIHNMADEKNVAVEDTAEQEGKDIYSGSVTSETISIGVGLSGLAETKKQDSQD